MNTENEMQSPVQEVWTTPDDVFSECSKRQPELMMSTPEPSVWPLKCKSLEDSNGSSKQDSGYCSLTPISSESSGGIFENRCPLCSKLSTGSFKQSTPHTNSLVCSCKKNTFGRSQSENLELKTVSESKMSPKINFPERVRRNQFSDMYDEAMDTSLYPDEMEVHNIVPGEHCHHSLDLMEIGEEKSIDFLENDLCSTSGTTNKELSTKNIGKTQDIKMQQAEKLFSTEVIGSCNIASPKVRNETTPTKSKRTSNFCTVAKKVTVLNSVIKKFSLNGIDCLDFLYQLAVKKNYIPIVSQIFSFLSDKDLDTVSVVSKTWNDVLKLDSTAFNRWKLYKATLNSWIENSRSPVKTGRQRPTPLSPFHSNTNWNSPGPRRSPHRFSPPISPESARFRSFQKAAKTLKSGERLLPCPRCYFPCHDRGSPSIQCSRTGCRHKFCVWCRHEITSAENHECPPLYTPLRRRHLNLLPAIGSKTCKRNLRRL